MQLLLSADNTFVWQRRTPLRRSVLAVASSNFAQTFDQLVDVFVREDVLSDEDGIVLPVERIELLFGHIFRPIFILEQAVPDFSSPLSAPSALSSFIISYSTKFVNGFSKNYARKHARTNMRIARISVRRCGKLGRMAFKRDISVARRFRVEPIQKAASFRRRHRHQNLSVNDLDFRAIEIASDCDFAAVVKRDKNLLGQQPLLLSRQEAPSVAIARYIRRAIGRRNLERNRGFAEARQLEFLKFCGYVLTYLRVRGVFAHRLEAHESLVPREQISCAVAEEEPNRRLSFADCLIARTAETDAAGKRASEDFALETSVEFALEFLGVHNLFPFHQNLRSSSCLPVTMGLPSLSSSGVSPPALPPKQNM